MQKIKGNLEEGTIFLGKKTKEAVEKMKLKMQIMKYKQQLGKQYHDLGKIMYSKKIGNQIDEAEVNRIHDGISLSLAYLKSLENSEQEEVFTEATESTEEAEIQLQPERNQEGYFLLKFCPVCQVGNNPEGAKCISCGAAFGS